MLTDSSTGEKFDLSFNTVKGVPTVDKTETFLAETPFGDSLKENEYIYAFDYHPGRNNVW